MTTSTLPQMVLAEAISRDQLNQLAAVMLGLVVFAAIFVLVERQRSRRGKEPDADQAAPIDPPPSTGPPRYVCETPTAVSPAPPRPTTPDVARDDLPVAFVLRPQEPAREWPRAPASEPQATPPEVPAPPPAPGAPGISLPDEVGPPEPPPAEHPPTSTPPASPDEIGIILPDEPPSPGSGAEPKG